MLKSLAAIARVTAILLSLLVCASLSVAGHRGGTALEDAGRTAPAARAIATPSARPVPACDDAPGAPGVAKVAPAPVSPRRELAPTLAPEPRTVTPNRRDRGRTAPNATRLHRQLQRGKGHPHGAPATPGMGLLLRMSTGAGREISWVDDVIPFVPAGTRSGRAPPRASPASNPAPASPPRVPALATSSRAPRPSSAADAPILEDHPDVSSTHASRVCECAAVRARAPRASAAAVDAIGDPEPVRGSSAAFPKGTTARSSTPFGGRFA